MRDFQMKTSYAQNDRSHSKMKTSRRNSKELKWESLVLNRVLACNNHSTLTEKIRQSLALEQLIANFYASNMKKNQRKKTAIEKFFNVLEGVFGTKKSIILEIENAQSGIRGAVKETAHDEA